MTLGACVQRRTHWEHRSAFEFEAPRRTARLATHEIEFTHEDDEVMELAGRRITLHRVRETPLGAPPEVYTLWWYDDQGMGVKRYHKTTQGEYRVELLAWR